MDPRHWENVAFVKPFLQYTMDGHATSPANSSRLLIVDAHAYAYRAFYAIRQLSSPSGTPTNAIYGFIKMMTRMQTRLSPTHLAVVWDGGLCVERMKALPEYKAQRPPMPSDLEQQLEGIERYLEAMNAASFCRAGVEADDWIASLARQAAAAGFEVVVASSDKDFMQLVCARVGLLNPNDKSEKIWTDRDVRAKTGVAPEQIVDWLSLIGDSVDNIPGVAGVGPKTAADLLNQFGFLDALYARLDEVKSEKLRGSLRAAAELTRRNRELIRLREDVAGLCALEDLRVKTPTASSLQDLFAQWGVGGGPIATRDSRRQDRRGLHL